MNRRHQSLIALTVLAGILLAIGPWSLLQAESPRYINVPALAVSRIGGKEVGTVHYVSLQLERDPQGRGPTVLFSETGVGTAVDEVWKEGARTALAAAAKVAGENARDWTLTIKNRSRFSLSSGPSASSAIAVGIIAAWRGDPLRSNVILTGVITADAKIEEVGQLPTKLQGAVEAHMRSMLVPKGEARTSEWDLFELGQKAGINVAEVETLREAYEYMTGIRP